VDQAHGTEKCSGVENRLKTRTPRSGAVLGGS